MRRKIAAGKSEAQVGLFSEGIRLQDFFTVTENAYLAGKIRAFYALGNIG